MKKVNSKSYKNANQAGLSLLELLIALGVLTVILVFVIADVNLKGSKAKSAFVAMNDLVVAQELFFQDTGCFAKTPRALINASDATAANTICPSTSTAETGRPVFDRWKGPYLAPTDLFTVVNTAFGSREAVTVPNLDVSFSFVRVKSGSQAVYATVILGLEESRGEFMQECNGRKANTPAEFTPAASDAANYLAAWNNFRCVTDTNLDQTGNEAVYARFSVKRN